VTLTVGGPPRGGPPSRSRRKAISAGLQQVASRSVRGLQAEGRGDMHARMKRAGRLEETSADAMRPLPGARFDAWTSASSKTLGSDR